MQHRITSLPVSWARRSPRRMSRRAGELSDVFPQSALGHSGRRKSRKNFAQSAGGAYPVFWSGNLIPVFLVSGKPGRSLNRWQEGSIWFRVAIRGDSDQADPLSFCHARSGCCDPGRGLPSGPVATRYRPLRFHPSGSDFDAVAGIVLFGFCGPVAEDEGAAGLGAGT